ncbi:DUF6578 domain-containing protein [Streptomyces resistomycificus]|uniref:DUF6578 domain-containing protein n=1 Tax=Streptomyces resistomycificus TaxID=67356 RepID=UPI0007C4C51E|nr:DUF6578 domain-containing protein [Streptomyces resistomycificus]
MGLWHVFYADWQMECCGAPFALGDEVGWPLLLSDADDVLGGGWHDQLSKIVGPPEEVRGEDGAVRVVRDETGLVVALHQHPVGRRAGEERGEARRGDPIRSVGLLTVETHQSAELPEVRGRVRAIQVVTQAFAEPEPGSGTWQPVPGERWLRSVDACPKWFGGPRKRSGAGAVVTLDVPATDSRLSYTVPRGERHPARRAYRRRDRGDRGGREGGPAGTLSTARPLPGTP